MGFRIFPYPSYVFLCLSICLLWLHAPKIQALEQQRKIYIIYMGDRAYSNISSKSFYMNMLSGILEGVPPQSISEYLLHTYENFQGCVAKLTKKEVKKVSSSYHYSKKQAEIALKLKAEKQLLVKLVISNVASSSWLKYAVGMNGVVSVFPNGKRYPHTTRSWDFMGFPQNVERSKMESDVTIGVLDSGIWPESESFRDENFGPPPSKWKGLCQTSNDNFICNNKIIGARYFRADGDFTEDDIISPRDTNGHGTHCASVAAGGVVNKANFLGLGLGTARGGVPSARIAVYKICWEDGICRDADILAAFDAAISDGVDIISLSVGSDVAAPYFEDPIAIGAFHAMRKGIFTSSAAGNSGPGLQTVGNLAPWLLSVGASTIDRKFTTPVQLGNGMAVEGVSLNAFDLKKETFPLIYGADAANKTTEDSFLSSRFCSLDTLNKTLVKGKIVLCDTLALEEPFLAGAAGVIMQGVMPDDNAFTFPLPASYLHADDYARVLSYTRNLTSAPYGEIQKSVEAKDKTAPFVVSFSSRGPNPISPGILKPDLIAPGVNILAAYSPIPPASRVMGDERHVKYNMVSGTSMACPHASAVAAYVKSFHPSWSEAAIKSAMMTTALPMTSAKNQEAELAYGSGHINPLKAIDPGLVYDAEVGDYVKFLCSQGLNKTAISIITSGSNRCQENTASWDLNYPSIALPASLGTFDTVFTRTVTNVGSPYSTYKATVVVSSGQAMVVKVHPSVLSFKSVGQKLSFTIRVYGTIGVRALMSASLVWDEGEHQVRSPIVVFNLP